METEPKSRMLCLNYECHESKQLQLQTRRPVKRTPNSISVYRFHGLYYLLHPIHLCCWHLQKIEIDLRFQVNRKKRSFQIVFYKFLHEIMLRAGHNFSTIDTSIRSSSHWIYAIQPFSPAFSPW